MFRLRTGRANELARGDWIRTTETSNAKEGGKSDLGAVQIKAIPSRPSVAGVILIISIWSARPEELKRPAKGLVVGRLVRAVLIWARGNTGFSCSMRMAKPKRASACVSSEA